MSESARVERFMENAAKVAAQVFRAAGEEDLNRIVWEILDGENAGTVTIYCPGVTDKEQAIKIPPALLANDYVTASVCVEEVFGAVAEVGSGLWCPPPTRARAAARSMRRCRLLLKNRQGSGRPGKKLPGLNR